MGGLKALPKRLLPLRPLRRRPRLLPLRPRVFRQHLRGVRSAIVRDLLRTEVCPDLSSWIPLQLAGETTDGGGPTEES